MIAEHIIERNIKLGREKREVFRWEIATGKDQVHPRKTPGIEPVIKYALNTI
jgi:hypothetical protein